MNPTEIQNKRDQLNLPKWWDDARVERHGTYWVGYTDPNTGMSVGFLAEDGTVAGRGRDGVVFDSRDEADEFAEVFGGFAVPR